MRIIVTYQCEHSSVTLVTNFLVLEATNQATVELLELGNKLTIEPLKQGRMVWCTVINGKIKEILVSVRCKICASFPLPAHQF